MLDAGDGTFAHHHSIMKIMEVRCNLSNIRIYLDTNLELVIGNKNVYPDKKSSGEIYLRFSYLNRFYHSTRTAVS
ncbi:hypothetical protein NRIC_27410 [Enterococcus florum]|uniref:Uncharacterized protein n=1 Tax=Enterococcus florum TaxID=2480627 RepID=A0A4P5PA76_9ENTE|nr:hypothetical protein NRIC_27410 [Enterococcus florum]